MLGEESESYIFLSPFCSAGCVKRTYKGCVLSLPSHQTAKKFRSLSGIAKINIAGEACLSLHGSKGNSQSHGPIVFNIDLEKGRQNYQYFL